HLSGDSTVDSQLSSTHEKPLSSQAKNNAAHPVCSRRFLAPNADAEEGTGCRPYSVVPTQGGCGLALGCIVGRIPYTYREVSEKGKSTTHRPQGGMMRL